MYDCPPWADRLQGSLYETSEPPWYFDYQNLFLLQVLSDFYNFKFCLIFSFLDPRIVAFIVASIVRLIFTLAMFLRLSKHSVGFAGACYPSFSSLRLSSSCWATLGVEIGAPLIPQLAKLSKHAKLKLPRLYFFFCFFFLFFSLTIIVTTSKDQY